MKYEYVNKDKLTAYRDFIPSQLITGAISGAYRILGVRVFEEPCGALVWEKEKGTDRGFLRSIYVDPTFRRIGAGEILLSGLWDEAGKEGVGTIAFSFSPLGDPAMILPFFEDMNIQTELYTFPFAEHTLDEISVALKKKKIGNAAMCGEEISTLDRAKRNVLRGWLSENFHEPLSAYITPEVPGFAVIKDSSVDAVLLMSGSDNGILSLDYLYQKGNDRKLLAGLLSSSVKRYTQIFRPDTTIQMMLTTDEACALHDGLFGRSEDMIVVCRGEILL